MVWAGKKGKYRFPNEEGPLSLYFKADEPEKKDTSHLYQRAYLEREETTELTTRFGTSFAALTIWKMTEGPQKVLAPFETTIMFLPFDVRRCDYTKKDDTLLITGSGGYPRASLIVGTAIRKGTYDWKRIDWGRDE